MFDLENQDFLEWLTTPNPKPEPKPTDAEVFRDLLSAWHSDPTVQRVDILASELASRVALTNYSICVGLMTTHSIPTLFGLVYFLDGYGIILRQRYRQQRDGVFVYVDRKQSTPSEYEGRVVYTRYPLDELEVQHA